MIPSQQEPQNTPEEEKGAPLHIDTCNSDK